MARLTGSRPGDRVSIKGREIEFTLWPSRPGRLHRGLQTRLFALDAWPLIRQVVEQECPRAAQKEALATLEQAEDFYKIGTGVGIEAARPLALYYSYMNLSKTLCLTRGARPSFDQAAHGLKERLRGSRRELIDAYLHADPTTPDRIQNFGELHSTLTGVHLAATKQFDLSALLPQILPGHRLWAQAANKQERFIEIHDLQFWHNSATRQIWLRIYMLREDLSRLGVSHRRLLVESGLGPAFHEVTSDVNKQICLEQLTTVPCPNNYPADYLHLVVDLVRPNLWMTVASIPPYRRYYVYLCPPAESRHRLPQLLSMYAVTFYLGSITRYRPHHFDALLKGAYGPRVRDFVTGQPQQFLYLMASEMSRRDIAKPSIL
jgi:hypothetical protein